jgi:pimeloyl-ACP methyl ester carboxylesterase
MHYYDWGDLANPRVLVCVHGLTRNGRDFDYLAQSLSAHYRVVCPDIVGRGLSDWLAGKDGYTYAQYMSDVTALIARVTGDAEQHVDWLGTSMGGLLGILLASLPRNPIRRLVVNDAGMLVPRAALERIATYVGNDARFDSLGGLEAHLRSDCAPFGALDDAQWRHLALHSAVEHADGTWGFRYDPAIGNALRGPLSDVDLAAQWDAVRCPVLLLRGAESDLLLRKTALEMTQRGPRAKLVEFAGTGHAPMLMNDEQVSAVREFLLAP